MQGLGYGILGALSSAFMSRLIHGQSGSFSIYELVWIRNSAIALGLFPLVAKELPVMITPAGRLLWLRGALGAVAVLLFFQLLHMTHVSEALFLGNLTPLLTLLLGMVLLNERPSRVQWLGTAIVVAALALRTLPQNAAAPLAVLCFALIVSVVQAISFVTVRKSTGQFSSLLIVFIFCVASLVVTPFFSLRWPTVGAAYGTTAMWGLILTGLGTQVFVTKSFESLTAGQATLIGQLSILFAAFVEVGMGERTFGLFDYATTGMLFVGLYFVAGLPVMKRPQIASVRPDRPASQ